MNNLPISFYFKIKPVWRICVRIMDSKPSELSSWVHGFPNRGNTSTTDGWYQYSKCGNETPTLHTHISFAHQ